MQPAAALKTPVRIPRGEYEGEMRLPSAGGAGGGGHCYRYVVPGALFFLSAMISGHKKKPRRRDTPPIHRRYRWWRAMLKGPLGGDLTVCWAAEMEGSQVASLNLGWINRWTPSCIADLPLSNHLGSIPSGGVRLQPSQPPWQQVTGHWSGCRTPYPQY